MEQIELDGPQPAAAIVSRKERILCSAAHAFASNGFRGASLRDIACEAAVSLTLLNHHFGSKRQLLEAVVGHHHDICRARLEALRDCVTNARDPLPLGQIVEAWVEYEYELHGSSDGEQYLRLMLKLADEAEVPEPLRQRLDCSEAVMLRAFCLALPDAPRSLLAQAFRSASSALRTGIRDFSEGAEPDDDSRRREAVDFTVHFILGGIGASLRGGDDPSRLDPPSDRSGCFPPRQSPNLVNAS